MESLRLEGAEREVEFDSCCGSIGALPPSDFIDSGPSPSFAGPGDSDPSFSGDGVGTLRFSAESSRRGVGRGIFALLEGCDFLDWDGSWGVGNAVGSSSSWKGPVLDDI